MQSPHLQLCTINNPAAFSGCVLALGLWTAALLPHLLGDSGTRVRSGHRLRPLEEPSTRAQAHTGTQDSAMVLAPLSLSSQLHDVLGGMFYFFPFLMPTQHTQVWRQRQECVNLNLSSALHELRDLERLTFLHPDQSPA